MLNATNLNDTSNKFNYFNQPENDKKLYCSENVDFCGRCWLLPSSLSPNSDFVSSQEKNIPSPETTDSNISSICSTDFNQVFGEDRNLFEFSSFKNKTTLEDWELIRLTVRELNQKLAGQDHSTVSALKQKRRTLKNRGYALNCRARRLNNQKQLEEENARLKVVNNQQAALLAEYERKLAKSEEALQKLNSRQSFEYQKQHFQQDNIINNNSTLSNQQQQISFKESERFFPLQQQQSFICPLESEEHTTIPIDLHQQMSSSSTVYNNLDFELWNSF